MGVLFIGTEEKKRIAAIIARACQPEHIWGDDGRGIDHAAHEVLLGTYLAKFTLTRVGGHLYRHLTVATEGAMVANPIMVQEIGMAFGFRDPNKEDGWIRTICDCGCNAIGILQRYEPGKGMKPQ